MALAETAVNPENSDASRGVIRRAVPGSNLPTCSLSLRLLSVKRGDDNTCFPRSGPKSSEMPRQSLAQVPEPVSGYFSG